MPIIASRNTKPFRGRGRKLAPLLAVRKDNDPSDGSTKYQKFLDSDGQRIDNNADSNTQDLEHQTSRFLALPAELRIMVYKYVLNCGSPIKLLVKKSKYNMVKRATLVGRTSKKNTPGIGLLAANSQILGEACNVLYGTQLQFLSMKSLSLFLASSVTPLYGIRELHRVEVQAWTCLEKNNSAYDFSQLKHATYLRELYIRLKVLDSVILFVNPRQYAQQFHKKMAVWLTAVHQHSGLDSWMAILKLDPVGHYLYVPDHSEAALDRSWSTFFDVLKPLVHAHAEVMTKMRRRKE